jgi:hypothetical protein
MTPRDPVETTNLDRYGHPPLPWGRALEQLSAGPHGPEVPFFLATVRPDGRPHSAGIGAIHLDGDLYFTSGPATRKSRNLAANPACTISVRLEGIDLALEGEAARERDPVRLERAAARYREGGWPAEVEGDALTAPYSAPSAGPPPWQLYRFRFHTVVGVATAEPHGGTRWRFRAPAAPLAALIGDWTLEAAFPQMGPGGVGGRCTFEWMPGERFLVQRWEVDEPNAPDGVAILGPDPGGLGYHQHYFDSRGVARVYEMSLDDGVWRLSHVARLLAAGLRAALRGRLLRGRRHDRRPLGELPRRIDVGARLRAHVPQDGPAAAWKLSSQLSRGRGPARRLRRPRRGRRPARACASGAAASRRRRR